LRRSLCLDLDLDQFPKLNLSLDLNLGRSLFPSVFRRLFASSFGSMLLAKKLHLDLNLYINPAAGKLRGEHGRGTTGKCE